ncbi:MAG: hypothetical protein KBS96_00720 [Lachnospiraceae bacterium]|nr:hypothetical protein [Candidatus Colinaster scatohippi]
MKKEFGSKKLYIILMIIIIVLQIIAAFYFCTRKQGCHYDEYYSYYSSNVTSGLIPTDNEWMDTSEIANEFKVTDGKEFEYGMVTLMQTYDVHPPLYYYVLHTVCSFSRNVFSLWQGLGINLFFFFITILMVWKISDLITDGNQHINLFTVSLFGFSPAIISGVTFIRMYMMLTFLCMVSFYIHVKALKDKSYNWKNLYIPVLITTFLGFMTHYYFAVFMFFVAAYMTLNLFIKKDTRRQSILYATSVIAGMLLVVAVYPSCLRHIFRGYRGTEAMGAFFDMANLKERAGLFVGLLQEYVLCNMFYIVALAIILLGVTYHYKKKGSLRFDKAILGLTITVTAGYFLVVLKTALTNAEEAIRYEMPIYGLLILLMVIAVFGFAEPLINKKNMGLAFSIIIFTVALVLQIKGLASDKVLFLYEDDAKDYAWAKEHSTDTIVYIYNYENQWMIWDDAMELMNYDRIFFIDMNNEEKITDADVMGADHLYVFSVRSEQAAQRLNEIVADKNMTSSSVVRNLKYVDVYELR